MGKIELEMNEYEPLREVVFASLRKAILEGILEPGERLMEIHLAGELGVSRTPVREAIHKLEQEGLVITYPRRGAVVAQITRKDLEDALEVRAALEELSVRKAAQCITPEQLGKLKKAAADFESCTKNGDVTASARADVAFHEILSEASGNQRLLSLLYNLRGQLYRYRMENLKDAASYAGLIAQHRQLCLAMEKQDGELAARTLREHIAAQKKSILEKIEKP